MFASHASRDGWQSAALVVSLAVLAGVLIHFVSTLRSAAPRRTVGKHLAGNLLALAAIPVVGLTVSGIPDSCAGSRLSEGYECDSWVTPVLIGMAFSLTLLVLLVVPYVLVFSAKIRRRNPEVREGGT